MRPEDVLRYIRKEPFRPFRIHLSNGLSFDIRHPELAIVGKHTLIIFTPAADFPGVFDSYEEIALIHINNIEFIPATPATTDGSGKPG